jgi:hypothetical protein
MLLTQEPTFVIFMVVTQEPTIRKTLPLMHFKSWNDFIKKPKVPKNNHARLHEDMQPDQLGGGGWGGGFHPLYC